MTAKELKQRIEASKINSLVLWTLRLIVGGVLIFSGFVKAVDPWGSYYKFSEYLNAFSIQSNLWIAEMGAFFVPLFEFSLGLFLILGIYKKMMPWVLTLFMSVMFLLTFHIAITDTVPDCGCFGDAVTLTNWETFAKNAMLLTFVLYILIFRKKLTSIYGNAVHWIISLLALAFISNVISMGYSFQPVIDFRPYKVGTYLLSKDEEDKLNHDESEDYVYVYERNGEQKEFVVDSLPDDDEWDFVERKRVGRYLKPDTGDNRIVILDGDKEVTGDVLSHSQNQLIYLFPDIANVDISYSYQINEFTEKAENEGYNVFALSSGTKEAIEEWIDMSMASYPVYGIDDSDLKIIARGNPAAVCVEHGIIKWKSDLEWVVSDIESNPDLTISTACDEYDFLSQVKFTAYFFLVILVALLIVNRGYKLIKIIYKKIRNVKK